MNATPVKTHALVMRINRALKHKNLKLKKMRGMREYFLVDVRHKVVEISDVDVGMLAGELHVLRGNETAAGV